ncbi:MAG: hypothetical protein ACTSXG_01850 [Alphaproteobacteria bacterium]
MGRILNVIVVISVLLCNVQAMDKLEKSVDEWNAAFEKGLSILVKIDEMPISERIAYLASEVLKVAKNPDYEFYNDKSTAFWEIGIECCVKTLSEIPSPAHAILLFDINELAAAQHVLNPKSSINHLIYLLQDHYPTEVVQLDEGQHTWTWLYMNPSRCISTYFYTRTLSFPRELYGYPSLKKEV